MKMLIELDVQKLEGKTCDLDEVFTIIEEMLDAETIYPHAELADEESTYEITLVTLKR